jgi:ribosomal protein L40E
MYCGKCGAKNPEGNRFCSSCGAHMGGKPLCGRCGAENPEGNRFCSSCGAQIGGTPDAASAVQSSSARRVDTEAAPSGSEAISGHVIAIAVGGIMMLVALALTWYTTHAEDVWGTSGSATITFGDLMDSEGLNWAGNPMPLILMSVSAGAILLLVGHSWLAGVMTKERTKLWSWLGSLAALCLLANIGYLNYEGLGRESGGLFSGYAVYFTPHAGWVVAFAGVLVVKISSALARKRLQ